MTTKILIMILGASLLTGACSAPAPETSTALDSKTLTTDPATATTSGTSAEPRRAAETVAPAPPPVRVVTIPEGTSLTVTLTTAVASDTSRVEDSVSADLATAVTIDGDIVLPAGAKVVGVVTSAESAGRVKGRASVAFRFNSLRVGSEQYDIETAAVSRLAPATKGQDATKIGIGAGAGAALGAIFGGKKGAAEGAAIGGGGGAGVVLATKGKEVRLAPGEDVTTKLSSPLTVRIGARN